MVDVAIFDYGAGNIFSLKTSLEKNGANVDIIKSFDQSKKYTSVDNLEKICVQCQAGQHKKCLFKSKEQPSCDCEHCLIYG